MNFNLLHSFDNYIEANLMKGRLESEGVRCWLKDEYTVTIDPILSNAVGGIKLMVAEPDLQKAIALYQEIEQEKRARFACPACKSHSIEYITTTRNPANWLMAVATWLLGNYAMSSKKIWHCFNCNTEFEQPVEMPLPEEN